MDLACKYRMKPSDVLVSSGVISKKQTPSIKSVFKIEGKRRLERQSEQQNLLMRSTGCVVACLNILLRRHSPTRK